MFADLFVLLLTGHWLADYPGQTDRQAARKAGWTEGEDGPNPGRHHHGWGENLLHAATHVAITAVLLLGAFALDLHPSTAGLAAGLAWIGASHSFIDRRWAVRWWMERTGQAEFLAQGGAAYVDQAAHVGLGLLPAALAITLL
ncbi:DUF3307 domain-containing protein [Kitasatospora sp. NPDC052868]|uniref:DUF3307 domain-containing protein n=1 Tax=Kitasatospora sp. NPDC052868 TaxID=3364060 RepID=UPI0037C96AA6